ncbi:transmembrane protein 42 [Oratosquilla oratoria]|uniref:transmembrane protein 42 n=1 Tax=Oratosquilla oratoria TaxID=337810 RepID=UPI003F75DC99
MKGQIYAVSSGLLAALASLCGKYAVASSEAHELCLDLLAYWYEDNEDEYHLSSQLCQNYGLYYIHATFLVLMISINCVMWTTFTKALNYSSTSIEATITNTAANFFFTAILGQVLFGEVVNSLWWLGTVLILCGLVLMHHSHNKPARKPGTRLKRQ